MHEDTITKNKIINTADNLNYDPVTGQPLFPTRVDEDFQVDINLPANSKFSFVFIDNHRRQFASGSTVSTSISNYNFSKDKNVCKKNNPKKKKKKRQGSKGHELFKLS